MASKDGAPGKLEAVRQFVNTIDFEDGRDELASPARLADWLACHSLPTGGSLSDLDLLGMRAFRECLRDLCYANNGQGAAKEAWQALAVFARRATIGLTVDPLAGRLGLAPRGAGLETPISAIFGIIYDAIAAGQWARLKACRKESCRFAFFDSSKNSSGAWCSMAVCGNRVKAQRRRARASG